MVRCIDRLVMLMLLCLFSVFRMVNILSIVVIDFGCLELLMFLFIVLVFLGVCFRRLIFI